MKFAFPFRPLRRARRPRPGPAPSPRSGSALVIVLGMLSVLLLMAVAFSSSLADSPLSGSLLSRKARKKPKLNKLGKSDINNL